MKILSAIVIAVFFSLLSLGAIALEKKDVVGEWTLDKEKSKIAKDGNTAGVMNKMIIKEDGTFEALYGTKGTFKINAKGEMEVTYSTSPGLTNLAIMDGTHLAFPAPANPMKKKCYLKRAAAQ